MDDKELFLKCKELSDKIMLYRTQFIALLPEVSSRKLYAKHGYQSISEFAAKLAGISPDTTRKIMAIVFKIKDNPFLKGKFESGKIGWSKMAVIIPVLTEANQFDLVRKAETMSKPALEQLVRDYKVQTKFDPGVKSKFSRFSSLLSPKTIVRLRVIKSKFEKIYKRVLTWDAAFDLILEALDNVELIRKSKSKSNFNKLKTATRYVPVEVKNKVYDEFQGKCSVETCLRSAQVLHHGKPFAVYRDHSQILPYCREHHEILHYGFMNAKGEVDVYGKLEDPVFKEVNSKFQFYREEYVRSRRVRE
jgi:hypothetical protein